MLEAVASGDSNNRCIVVYAHGGGYARGEARMYLKYMERWEKVAKEMGVDVIFLSVEYRESLMFSSTQLALDT
jgi:carboxylesterase type B